MHSIHYNCFALASLVAIMCFEFGSFIKRSYLFDLVLLHVCGFLHHFDKMLDIVVFEFALIDIVEIQNCAVFSVLMNLEVTKFTKEMSDVFS